MSPALEECPISEVEWHAKEAWLGSLLLVLFCLLLSIRAEAQVPSDQQGILDRSVRRNDTRALGMGNAYSAYGHNANAFLYNPALLTQSSFDLTLIGFQINISDNFLHVLDFVTTNADSLRGFTRLTTERRQQLYDDINQFDDQSVRFGFSPMLTFAWKGFGLALYNRTFSRVKVDKGIYEPRVSGDALIDLVIIGGAAKDVTPRLTLGGSLKIINRRKAATLVSPTSFEQRRDILGEVLDNLRYSGTGWALDLGALYLLQNDRTRIALVIQDLGGKVGQDRIPTKVRLGLARFLLDRRLAFALDLDDLFNNQPRLRRVRTGLEARIRFLQLRTGLYQGYWTFGIGLNVWVIKLDYAFWGRELGRVLGQRVERNHQFRIRFGIGR